MKIENRLSTLTNEIKENLSLLGDGCSLLTSRREILLLGSVRESIMTPSKTSSEKNYIGYFTSDNEPDGIINSTHNTFSKKAGHFNFSNQLFSEI
jgi:hypothetical protein